MATSKSIIYFILLSIAMHTTVFAQTIRVISHPDLKPLANASISLDGRYLGITDDSGTFTNTAQAGLIKISFLGYISQTFPQPKTDTTILLLPASILLNEVIFSPPKEQILGYFGAWGNGVIHGIPDFNSAVVNSVTLTKYSSLKSFLFYIPNYPTSQTNIPFEFVIYKQVGEKYAEVPIVKPLRIEQYDFLWNSYSLTPFDISLAPGNYLFGMRWIKSAINENKRNRQLRQSLGTINKGNTAVNSYRSTPDKGWQLLATNKDGVTHYSIALLGLIIAK